jgi:anti-sigma28 factor (negative regulator of flagellin synthesis)
MLSSINSGISSATNGILNKSQVRQNGENQKTNETKAVNRVEEIKKEIEAGTYKIDVQKTAEAMAETLI